MECWGASGGNSYYSTTHGNTADGIYSNTVYGGKGGYSSGIIGVTTSLYIYIYVGQTGEGETDITFNGGGSAATSYNSYSGGGATDIRLVDGTWNNFNSLKSRIIIAAGGGGAVHYNQGCNGGYAGGLLGGDGEYAYYSGGQHGEYTISKGGTQNSGGEAGKGFASTISYNGTFGHGGNHNSENHGSGGGGGYYGGGGGGHNSAIVGTGAGGSSFISGHTGCNAITSSSTSSNIIHTGQPNHYSGYVFTNTVMKAGNESMPSPTGGTETGHSGNGYCKITWHPAL